MHPLFIIDPASPDLSLVEKAADIMRHGGVIAYPTETFYGLGCDTTHKKAIEHLFSIKGRSVAKPVPLIIGTRGDLARYVRSIPRVAEHLIGRYWPGALTIIFEKAPFLSEALTAGTGKIAIRLSSNPIAALLARALSGAITATSANLSHERECTTADEVMKSLGGRINAIIDGGTTPGGTGSTIVDVTEYPPVVVRQGVIALSDEDLYI
ncbi:MAG: L-threonylcarbamoyladenylate synthase [Deltaproteobacteria bacterium]|nr:L-threonylcarbamoyladenylate synthase [Deltaproteobacteria bacterium]